MARRRADPQDADWRRGCFAGRAALVLAVLLVTARAPGPARAETQDCVRVGVILWGDGRHDDTQALNAWLDGAPAIWGDSGAPVGSSIAGRDFRLSAPVYVRGGSGRTLDDFRMVWPQRGETVSGGKISEGGDPQKAPVLSGVNIVGGDPTERQPFDLPEHAAKSRENQTSCATS